MKKIGFLMAATALVAAGSAHAESHEGRATDGHLNIIYWQAPSLLNPYLSGGTKELEASSLVIEPLARYDETGTMVPFLVDEIPTVDNGGVSEDLTTITWTLSEGIKWSDGTPLTAADAVFTWQYCTDPESGCAQLSNYNDVESVEAVDDRTIKITFSVPKPFPYGPFVGAQSPVIQAAQFADCLGAAAPTCTDANFAPIGTGPFVVTDFKANDVASFVANENYRDPMKPAFATLNLKGGGDAASAARSVLETGEFDYAWNLQVEPEILNQMAAAGQGTVVSAFGTSVERMHVNQTDPDPELGDERATVAHPHPFLTDPNVSRALSLAIDREILVEAGYGSSGQPTCNVLPAPAIYASTNNDWCLNYDPDEANRLLDEAGWVMGDDGVRTKDGERLSILYQTSTNSVRQGTQALVKQMWEEIGVETELRNIDGSVFFGGDPSSPDTFQKFFADIEMYTNNFDGTDPERYMGNWACAEIPSPETQWQGSNMQRFCSEEYDALVVEFGQTAALEDRAALAIKMNDMLMNSGSIIPLVHRGGVSAHSNSLEGVLMNEWDSELWNIADWTRAE
ncbi:peptide ABC transporter substrate-binding protein [Pontivivens nitratireducens]|uniref:Peptide ABC transporter substrate-binding protein n=1 Tax=Pontivivens nitratireducens TaxID=2758038 RepID=A0A6G7VLS6_9RHOB|nr:peptide ABC transporter substrate-binding protein [Pontibrevibacter nitratireducens]QIK40971.1 peptide ABC transporter substrate-binding protein [Pontibrevibacter nitratireducens]